MNMIIKKGKEILKNKNKFIFIAVVVIVLVLFTSFQKVEIGQNGVLYNSISGEVTPNVSSGWHVVVPFFQNLVTYPNNDTVYKIYRDSKNWINGVDASIVTATSDNQEVSVDVTFIFSLDEEKLQYIFERFNGKTIEQIENDYLDDVFKSSVTSAITKYTAYEVYSTKRDEVQAVVYKNLLEKLSDIGVIIKDVYFETVRLSYETEAIIKAESLAEAARIEAEGKSDANKLISDSLTDEIITYEALQKMSESLKLIIVPSSTEGQIDYSQIIEQILNEVGEQQSQQQGGQ